MNSGGGRFECDQVADAAPYVLGALDEPESYRDHLEQCATCRAEVSELEIAVDVLPVSVPALVAPESLRDRVMSTVRAEADLLKAAGSPSVPPSRAKALWRGSPIRLLAGGMAAAAGVAALLAVLLSSGSTAPVRVTVAQVSKSVAGASASLREVDDRAELVVSHMPQPAPGKIYEVWLNRGGASPQPTDALFGVTSRGSGSVAVPGDLHGVREVLVTSEPTGGSSRPTSEPVLRVTLRS